MLSYLSVRNLASIEAVEINFGTGLNVLTGETGAGKTVLVQAIGLLLGDRADSVRIRQGASGAELKCTFEFGDCPEARIKLVESGILSNDESELMLGRTISVGGKNKCSVNGRLCPLSVLSEIGDISLDLHGQNTHQALVNTNTHREYLDRYAGQDHLNTLAEYGKHYRRMTGLKKEKEGLSDQTRDIGRKVDLLSHEIRQIDDAAVEIGELETLEEEISRMRHSRELVEWGDDIRSMLLTGNRHPCAITDTLETVLAEIRRMGSIDGSLNPLAERLQSVSYELEDIGVELVDYIEKCDFDPGRQQQAENRINVIRDLFRKFGGSVEELLEYRDRAAGELSSVENSRERLSTIDRELGEEIGIVEGLAVLISKGRRNAAGRLEKEVNRELGELEMGNSRIKVEFGDSVSALDNEKKKRPEDFGPFGTDKVEFIYAPQKGMLHMPLRKIASGGEISRAMLAIKIVLAGADRIPVLIFDEVDTGVGGETAGTVGEKLYSLTKHHQVLCITHQPQIATFADSQYRVSRDGGGEKLNTSIELLSDQARVDEMCRMLGDSSGRQVTKEHASDILKRSEKKKRELKTGE